MTAKVEKGAKLDLRTKTLMKQRREMTDNTTAEYRNINEWITKEMRKYRRENNAENIEYIIENRSRKSSLVLLYIITSLFKI